MSKIDNKNTEFDFERWRKLAETDPSSFEQQRADAIAALIEGVPNADLKQRLHRLQWRVDMERRRSRSALGACVRMYNMMWESVNQNYELMQSLVAVVKPTDEAYGYAPKATKASVLPFRRRVAE